MKGGVEVKENAGGTGLPLPAAASYLGGLILG